MREGQTIIRNMGHMTFSLKYMKINLNASKTKYCWLQSSSQNMTFEKDVDTHMYAHDTPLFSSTMFGQT